MQREERTDMSLGYEEQVYPTRRRTVVEDNQLVILCGHKKTYSKLQDRGTERNSAEARELPARTSCTTRKPGESLVTPQKTQSGRAAASFAPPRAVLPFPASLTTRN